MNYIHTITLKRNEYILKMHLKQKLLQPCVVMRKLMMLLLLRIKML